MHRSKEGAPLKPAFGLSGANLFSNSAAVAEGLSPVYRETVECATTILFRFRHKLTFLPQGDNFVV
jgi:hypothetical protein